MDRKSNEIIFRKCADPRCLHCSKRPVIAKEAWDYLKERDFKWANPVPSLNYPNHYITFVEVSQLDKDFLLTGTFCTFTIIKTFET